MFGNMVSDMMIKPGASPVFGTPADVGLEHEDVTFEASDGVKLSGWLVRGGTDKVVVQSHFGVQCSRAGFTPKGKGMVKLWPEDISFLAHAKHLVEQGWSVLMYDFRNHGESAAGTTPWVTWGPEEAKDVIAAVEFVNAHADYQGCQIGLLSICMGAASSTYAFGAADGLASRENIAAMVAIQPLLYPDFVKGLGIPGFLDRSADKANLKRTGIDLKETSFMPNVKDINVPTLVVQNKNDPWANLDAVQRYHDELRVEKELRWLELEKGRAAAYAHLETHPELVSDWLGKHIG